MGKKQEIVRETLYSETFYGYSDISWTIPETIKWLQELLAKVPPEHHAASRFEISSDDNYGDGNITALNIYFDRPMTDEETAARKAEEQARREMAAARQRADEIATYEALKRKYG